MSSSNLAAQLTTLRQRAVRDLAWTITSPPLLHESVLPQRHPLAGSRWLDHPDMLWTWLQEQDHAPDALHVWLAQTRSSRLGHYYERLWQFALTAAPDITLHAANVPIREPGRTLGELDLLLECAGQYAHIELAIKFYLGWQDSQGDVQWIGPDGQDRLHQKISHLREHQLMLPRSAAAQATLAAMGIGRPEPACWLGGYLFYPWPHRLNVPAEADPGHNAGHWVYPHQWSEFAAGQQWHVLPRANWLSPADLHAVPAQALDPFDPADTPVQRAHMLVRLDEAGREVQRAVIVPSHWPLPAP